MKKKNRNKEEIIHDLEVLSHTKGYIYALVLMLKQDQFISIKERVGKNPYDQLSFQEFSFLVGLMCKEKVSLVFIPKTEVTRLIKETYQLFKELHLAFNIPFIQKLTKTLPKDSPNLDKDDMEKAFKDFFRSGQLMAEPIFYSDSGAYDFQFWELTPRKYIYDLDWLKNNHINIDLYTQIARFLKTLCEIKLTSVKENTGNFEKYCKDLLSVFCFSKDDFKNLNKEDLNKFLELFSIKNEAVNKTLFLPGQYNVLESHPILELEKGLFFMPIAFNLSKSIYESPFYWMNQDTKYINEALKHRGLVTVDIGFSLLTKVFGKKNVYRDIRIVKSKKDVTDIDLLVLFRNKAVIFQVKSKRLTSLSRTGDEESLQKDFNEAAQNAYNQAILSRKAILEKDSKFLDSSGKELELSEFINDAYIVCLTTDDYPGLHMIARSYLNKQASDPFPMFINIFDLEIICFYLDDPFALLYYLRQRAATYDYFLASSEMSFLSWHIQRKLFTISGYNGVGIDNAFTLDIDENYPSVRGYLSQVKPQKKLKISWFSKDYEDIIDVVKRTKSPGFVDAVYELYDSSSDAAEELVDFIKKTKMKANIDKANHDFTLIYNNNKAGISYISQSSPTPNILTSIMNLSVARKYKTKADIWLGLISRSESEKLVECVVFNMQPWKFDLQLEKMSSLMLKPGIVIKSEKTGRNDPCPCGSGKKYKKCCLLKS